MLLPIALLAAASVNLNWVADLGGRVTKNPKGDITGVHLRGSFISDADLDALAAIPTLETIDLAETRVTDLGLLRLKGLKNVRELNLLYAELITDEGLAVMRTWTKVERLNLRGTKVTDNTLALLAGKDSIRTLDIGYAEVTDSGLQYLPKLKGLKELAFGGNKLTEVGLEVLRGLPNLTHLDIAGKQRTDSGLWFVAVTDIGLDPIASLTELRTLDISGSPVSTKGIQRLAGLKKLERLNLYQDKRITDDAGAVLAGMSSLKWVDLKESGMTAKGFAALKKARPDLAVAGDPSVEPVVTSVEFENFLFRALLLADPKESYDAPATLDIDLKTVPPRRVRVEFRDYPAKHMNATEPVDDDKLRVALVSCPARANCPVNEYPALDVALGSGQIVYTRKGAPARYNEGPLPLDLIRVEWKGKLRFE